MQRKTEQVVSVDWLWFTLVALSSKPKQYRVCSVCLHSERFVYNIALDKVLYFIWKIILFFLFLHKNICCGYSLELPWWGNSNKYPQHMFLWRNKIYIYWTIPMSTHTVHLCGDFWISLSEALLQRLQDMEFLLLATASHSLQSPTLPKLVCFCTACFINLLTNCCLPKWLWPKVLHVSCIDYVIRFCILIYKGETRVVQNTEKD